MMVPEPSIQSSEAPANQQFKNVAENLNLEIYHEGKNGQK
jgi:hypothetical protein